RWRHWRGPAPAVGRLHVPSVVLCPVGGADIGRGLARGPATARERDARAGLWPQSPAGRIEITLEPRVRLTVVCGAALDNLPLEETGFDAWFLDGFAPSRNPAMWSAELMTAVFQRTLPGGSFATYTAAGFVRRNLAAAGFTVLRQPGFAEKREMLSGSRPDG